MTEEEERLQLEDDYLEKDISQAKEISEGYVDEIDSRAELIRTVFYCKGEKRVKALEKIFSHNISNIWVD